MSGRSKYALALLVLIAAVVIFVVATNIETWRGRTNPSITNGGPANAAMPTRPPAP